MTPIKYVGHRPTYTENCYGTGLVFAQGQTIAVDEAVARQLLRHPDVYVLGEASDATIDASECTLKDPTTDPDAEQNDARDAIMAMGKDALKTYAKTHFRIDLDGRKKVGDLRTQVVGLFDQFGVE